MQDDDTYQRLRVIFATNAAVDVRKLIALQLTKCEAESVSIDAVMAEVRVAVIAECKLSGDTVTEDGRVTAVKPPGWYGY